MTCSRFTETGIHRAHRGQAPRVTMRIVLTGRAPWHHVSLSLSSRTVLHVAFGTVPRAAAAHRASGAGWQSREERDISSASVSMTLPRAPRPTTPTVGRSTVVGRRAQQLRSCRVDVGLKPPCAISIRGDERRAIEVGTPSSTMPLGASLCRRLVVLLQRAAPASGSWAAKPKRDGASQRRETP